MSGIKFNPNKSRYELSGEVKKIGGFLPATMIDDLVVLEQLYELGATQDIDVACSDEITPIAAGTAKLTMHTPFNFILLSVFAGLTTPDVAGDDFIVDINKSGTSVLSTKIHIDPTEETSLTSSTQPVVSTQSFLKGDKITIDVDQIGDVLTPTATGLKVYMKVRRL